MFIWENFVYIISHYGWKEMKFYFEGGCSETAHINKPEWDIETSMFEGTIQTFVKKFYIKPIQQLITFPNFKNLT